MISKSQIDKLGQRLRLGEASESDLKALDEYRHSFITVYEVVVKTIRDTLGLEPTGRPDKTTASITEKLRSESSMCLSRMQDIAGCRLIVRDIAEQDRTVAQLTALFPHAGTVDRRQRPSHGYRAV